MDDVRRRLACTTGPRRWRAGCAPARRWRWSAAAIRPARRWSIWPARRKGLDGGARAGAGGHHVALSGRPHRGLPNVELLTAHAGHRAGGRGRRAGGGALAHRRRAEEVRRPIRTCSSSSAPIPTPTGWPAPAWRWTPRASSLTGGEAAGTPLETSRAGVFAIGDVRAGSVKRVAAAVGEGAQVVAALHGFFGAADVAARVGRLALECDMPRHDHSGAKHGQSNL